MEELEQECGLEVGGWMMPQVRCRIFGSVQFRPENIKELQGHFKRPREGGRKKCGSWKTFITAGVSDLVGVGGGQGGKEGTYTDVPIWHSDNTDSQLCHEFAGWLTFSRKS